MRLLTFLTAIGLPTNAMVVRPSFKSAKKSRTGYAVYPFERKIAHPDALRRGQ